MRTNLKSKYLALILSAFGVLFLSQDTLSAGAGGPGTGVPGSGPVAGPVEVFTFAEVIPGPVGQLIETTIVVENQGDDPVSVLLLGRFTWPDGSSHILRYGPPVIIAPDETLILIALSPVPDSVGSGTGTFTGTAIVGSIGPAGRGGFTGRLIARDNAAFELR